MASQHADGKLPVRTSEWQDSKLGLPPAHAYVDVLAQEKSLSPWKVLSGPRMTEPKSCVSRGCCVSHGCCVSTVARNT